MKVGMFTLWLSDVDGVANVAKVAKDAAKKKKI